MIGLLDTPGFIERDTVAHCGHSLKGKFLWVLSTTDMVTGFMMLRTMRNKALVIAHARPGWTAKNGPGLECRDHFDDDL